MRKAVLLAAALLAVAAPASANVYEQFKAGQAAADAKQNAKAVEIFTQVIDSQKLTGEWLAYAYYYRGQAHRREQDWVKAAPDLKQAMALAPAFPGSHFELGLALHGQKDYPGAVAAFDKAIELKPNDADYWYSRCVSKQWQNDEAGVLADCGKAVELKADYLQALALIGRVYEDRRQCSKAEDLYKQVLKLDPKNKSAREGLDYIAELRKPGAKPSCES